MNYAAKSDANQPAIVEDLRKLGYDVDIVSREKKLYDIIVSGVASWSNRHAVAVRVEIDLGHCFTSNLIAKLQPSARASITKLSRRGFVRPCSSLRIISTLRPERWASCF